MKTLILDNYDSFTYNLFQYVAELGGHPIVKKNDEITLKEINRISPTHIIISPGPGTPTKKRYFGICANVIEKYLGILPLLGVCLGHQGIAHVLGGRVIKAPYPMHGKTSIIEFKGIGHTVSGCKAPNIFRNLSRREHVMRYHSLMVEPESMPKDLVITAETLENSLVMAFQHKQYPAWGIQFHPESIETPCGKPILKNFLKVK